MDLYLMITVYFGLNIKTCCFGASRLDNAKLNYFREQRDSGSCFQGLSL